MQEQIERPESGLTDAIADLAPDSVVVRDLEGRVRLWNKASERLYGIVAADALGQSLDTLVATRHSFGVASLEAKLRQDGAWIGEVYRTSATGEPLCVEVRWQLRRDAHGVPLDILEWGRDLSAEDALRSEAAATAHRYRNLFHAMAASFWELDFSYVRRKVGALVAGGVIDLLGYFTQHPEFIDDCIANTVILDVNETTIEMFGAPSREAILDLPMGWEWPAESRQFYAAAVAAAARGSERYVAEVPLHRWDGSLMDSLFTVCWPSDHKAQGSVLVGVIDISDRKKMERELRASEAKYRDLFDFMPVAVWQMDGSAMKRQIETLRAGGETSLLPLAASNPEFRASDLLEIVEANSAAADIFGCDAKSDLLGPLSRIWDNEAVALDVCEARMKGEKYIQREVRLTAADSRLFDAIVTVAFPDVMSDQSVNLVALLDITERKRAEAELKTSEARYRTLFQHMPIALCELDTSLQAARLESLREQGVKNLAAHVAANSGLALELAQLVTITDANAEALRLLEASGLDELKGPVAPLWRDAPSTLQRSVNARLSGHSQFTEEMVAVTLKGNKLDALFSIAYPPELSERGVSVVGFVDIGERKRALEELRLSERRYRDLFQQVPMALWRLEPRPLDELLADLAADGVVDLAAHIDAHPAFLVECMRAITIVEVNTAAVALSGAAEASQLVGLTSESFWMDHPDLFRQSLLARYSGKQSFSQEGVMGTPFAGEVEIAFSTTYPGPTYSEGLSVVSTLDIRDRKQAELRLQRVQADFSHAARISTLGEMAASIAHEVNQPLAAITAYAQAGLRWLSRPAPDIDELRSLAEQIVGDARRASSIIARIRGMAMNQDPDHVRLDLNEVIEEALLVVQREIATHSVRLETDFEPALPWIIGDRVQIQQVIINIALNAAQAMGDIPNARREIMVKTAELAGGKIEVLVTDTGPGIAADHLDRLFEGFFTTKKQGMGMGLPICRSIIEAHGGFIRAENGTAGACFRIELPALVRAGTTLSQ